nr:probable protein phosphatase 2C 52 [Ipomoea batatas]
MGCCVSTSSESTCGNRSNGEKVSPECFGIGMFGRKRTFYNHTRALQHLASIPNRIFTNGRSRTSCIFTQQGRKGINQDAMIVWEDFMAEDVTFCGVFDGHGPHGHMVARKVRDALPLKLLSFLQSSESKHGKSTANCCKRNPKLDVVDPEKEDLTEDKAGSFWRDAFLKSYKAMDKELRSHPNIDCFCSGSTAVTIVKQGSNLFMGNIGDSRAILASKDSNDMMVANQLTVDLKPDLPKEAERIKRCKGRVFALQDEPEVQRVWLPFDNAPGLAMARAFGDFCLKEYGVISIPEVSHRVLTDRDKFIVLASDGVGSPTLSPYSFVWDVLSNEEVVEIVSGAPSKVICSENSSRVCSTRMENQIPDVKNGRLCSGVPCFGREMDSESDYEEKGFSSATIQSNHSWQCCRIGRWTEHRTIPAEKNVLSDRPKKRRLQNNSSSKQLTRKQMKNPSKQNPELV